jgi:hypothetical protein
MFNRKSSVFLVPIVLFFNCTGSVNYAPPGSIMNTDGISSLDLQMLTQDILSQIEKTDFNEKYGASPKVAFINIKNNTSEIINTEMIYDKLIQAIIQSKKMVVLERNILNRILEERSLQQTGLTINDESIYAAQLSGAQALMAGSLDSIEKTNFTKQNIWIRLSLRFVSVANGEIDWTFSSELRKTRKKGFFND